MTWTTERETVAAVGTKSNRSGIGARMQVKVGQREMIGEVMSGGSFIRRTVWFCISGLGKAAIVDQLQIRWPSGTVQTWEKVAVNQ